MRLIHTFSELPANAFLAIGVFDGVHLGHQRVISQARDDARLVGGEPVVVTFDPHPIRVLRPSAAPLLLTATEHKLALLRQLGVTTCLLLKFDTALAAMSAEEFLRHLAGCRQITVGSRFRFGHNRAGDVALMQRVGLPVKEIPSVLTPTGEVISSTAIRQSIQAGNLDRAATMLGRPFSVRGNVEHGDHRGHEIGFPTANVNPHNEVLPPDGVYAVRVRHENQTLGGVINIGKRPTFAGQDRRLEVHILDFAGSLYGHTVEVEFVKKIRDEQKFAGAGELAAQIKADVAAARDLLR